MTKTTYLLEAHDYTENTPCEDPKICTDKNHWIWEEEFKNLAMVEDHLTMDDAPAYRLTKVTTQVTKERVW